MAERGTPASAEIREYMVNSGKLNEQQKAMFEFVDGAASLCGETPSPDPIGMSEINEALSMQQIVYSMIKFRQKKQQLIYGQNKREMAQLSYTR